MSIRKLASETLIYGLSSILGRFANFLLVPLYTWILVDAEFGDIAYFYALMGFLKVLYTLQLDTAFFRFGQDREQRSDAYSAILRPVTGYILLLTAGLLLLAPLSASWTGFPTYIPEFRVIALILALDAFTEFPLARLRLEQRPLRFAAIRITGIGVNIIVNVLLLLVLPMFLDQLAAPWLYPESRLILVLWANLIGSAITFLLVSRDLRFLLHTAGKDLFRPMFRYAAPLILVAFAGVINEMLDRQLLRFLLPGTDDEVRAQIGIYSANYRLAMVIALFTQAFRYAAEPFFFRESSSKNAQLTYARVSRLFTLAASIGLVVILLFQDWLKFLIGRSGSSYHEGLKILPILLTANILLGLYYNFSVWYKLTDKTRSGAWIAIGGAGITIIGNALFIPQFGYLASAWTTLVCYALMVIVSYSWGQKHYPVPYPLGRMALFILSALLVTTVARYSLEHLPDAGRFASYVGITLLFALGWGWPEYQKIRKMQPDDGA